MFFTPLGFIIIFTNWNYRVCLRKHRVSWQFKARARREQTISVFIGKPESLPQGNALLPCLSSPGFHATERYLRMTCGSSSLPRCHVSEKRSESETGEAGWLEDPLQPPRRRLRGCHALHVHRPALPPRRRAGHADASQHRERPDDPPPSYWLPGVPGLGPLHGFCGEQCAPTGLGEEATGGAAARQGLRAGRRLLRGGEHGAMVSCTAAARLC